MSENIEKFDNILEYYQQLTNESKIYFTNTLFNLGFEKVSKVLYDSLFSDEDILDSKLDYNSEKNLELLNGDDYENDDDYIEYSSEDADSILDLKRIDDYSNSDLYVVVDIDSNIIHMYSNNLEDIEYYKYENIYLKGMFFVCDKNKPNTKNYKYYECVNVIGQLEQDICYN